LFVRQQALTIQEIAESKNRILPGHDKQC
jgi:hypothetical protein